MNANATIEEAPAAYGEFDSMPSGIGRFGGDWALEEFTTDHWVSIQHEPREYPIS